MKQILLTCDTEIGELSRDVDAAFDVFVLGRINGEQIGVPLINKIAKENGAVVNHFVDVYHPEYEQEFIALCETILAEGHFVGLHTHPGSRFGKRYMYEYEIEEQKKILIWGKEWLFKNVGIDVTTHRAGGYGADSRIYPALKETGFVQDSSFFYQAKECRMTYPYTNRISFSHGVWEFPVTVYKERRFVLGRERRPIFRKLDFRYGSDTETILGVVRKSPKDSILILFLHSFNFLAGTYNRKRKKFSEITVDRRLIEEYQRLLTGLRQMPDTNFVDFSCIRAGEHDCDFVDEVHTDVSVAASLRSRLSARIWREIPF